MKKPLIIILSAFILILTIVFTLQNAKEVEISYFFWNCSASLALLLFVTLSVGMLTTVIILVPVIAHLKKVRDKNDKKPIEMKNTKND
jgi:uncharacterized integral membrane protein